MKGDDDIRELFDKVAKHFDNAPEDSKAMFAMLVKITLKYRDTLVNENKPHLTVEETRKSLDAFMEILRTHNIPENLDKRVHDLVIMWLEELKTMVHH